MNPLFEQFKNKYEQGSPVLRLMILNITVFLLFKTSQLFLFLFKTNSEWFNWLTNQLSVPSAMEKLVFQPWSIITYMFFHLDFMHILGNMLVLFWIGNLFTEYLGGKKLVSTYILGGITGAIFYIISYNVFPAFTDVVTYSSLIGASAGVLAVLTAIATLLPEYQVHLIFFGPVKLKYIALFSIIIYAISIPQGNAGGQIAHLGGAFFGFVYIRQLQKGRDLALWFNNFTDWIMLSGKKKSKMKVAHKRFINDEDFKSQSKSRQEQIDHILDKISQSGYDSLSKEEKEILFNASKNKN